MSAHVATENAEAATAATTALADSTESAQF